MVSGRVLISEFDSIEQARVYTDEVNSAAAEQWLMGITRTASLLSETLLITDSMLLDGVFFLSVGPEAFANALGISSNALPITVLTTAASLQGALNAERDDKDFVWQVRDYVNLREGDEFWPYRRVRDAWNSWIGAAGNGSIVIEPVSSSAEDVRLAILRFCRGE